MPQPASMPHIPRQYLIQTNLPSLHGSSAKIVVCSFMNILVHSLQPLRHNETAPGNRNGSPGKTLHQWQFQNKMHMRYVS
jgi:hypothetical protein